MPWVSHIALLAIKLSLSIWLEVLALIWLELALLRKILSTPKYSFELEPISLLPAPKAIIKACDSVDAKGPHVVLLSAVRSIAKWTEFQLQLVTLCLILKAILI